MKEKTLKFIRRLSVFDWLAILVVLAGLVFISLFLTKQEKWIKVEVKVGRPEWWWETKNPPYWLVDDLRKGDVQYDSLGRKIAEVIEVKSFEWGGNQKVGYLTLNLKAGIDKRTQKLKFNNRPLEIGNSIELSLRNMGFQGLVNFIEGMPDLRQKEDKIIEARLLEWSDKFPETLGVLPWKADAIRVGDQMRDSQGQILAEILEKTVKPAEKIIVTSDGRVFVREDPIKKDVILLIKIRTTKQNGVNYYLDDIKVKVGTSIPLFLLQIDIGPEITRIVK